MFIFYLFLLANISVKEASESFTGFFLGLPLCLAAGADAGEGAAAGEGAGEGAGVVARAEVGAGAIAGRFLSIFSFFIFFRVSRSCFLFKFAFLVSSLLLHSLSQRNSLLRGFEDFSWLEFVLVWGFWIKRKYPAHFKGLDGGLSSGESRLECRPSNLRYHGGLSEFSPWVVGVPAVDQHTED